MDDERLVELACEARAHAYAPYSHWAVGAALRCSDGTVYQGCNIENAAYGPSTCAEHTAFLKAVYDGHRDFEAIAVVGGPEGGPAPDICAPCGVCRQVMMEFCDPASFRVVLGRSEGEGRPYLLGELLPEGFGPDTLR
ncbi:MAG: cytidine deaminase [Acidobacteriota bacterium]|nr:cytidine deaminase [Acidobacteriota bacterium]